MPPRKGYLESCAGSASSYWEISVAVHATLDLCNNFTHFFLCFAYFSAHAHVSSCTRMRTFSHYATFFSAQTFCPCRENLHGPPCLITPNSCWYPHTYKSYISQTLKTKWLKPQSLPFFPGMVWNAPDTNQSMVQIPKALITVT